MEGSSQATTTMPPFTPVMAELTKASAATFRPTCLKHTKARFPAYDMPSAASMAVFSLADHTLCTLRAAANVDCCTYSMISVDGVPG